MSWRRFAYVDSEGRLDEKDIAWQIAWFRTQGMLKDDLAAADIIDSRFVTPLPGE